MKKIYALWAYIYTEESVVDDLWLAATYCNRMLKFLRTLEYSLKSEFLKWGLSNFFIHLLIGAIWLFKIKRKILTLNRNRMVMNQLHFFSVGRRRERFQAYASEMCFFWSTSNESSVIFESELFRNTGLTNANLTSQKRKKSVVAVAPKLKMAFGFQRPLEGNCG